MPAITQVHHSQPSTSSSAAPPSSVFFLGGSVEFPNLNFSSELMDSTSPQFRLQAQALNHYVSGMVDSSIDYNPLPVSFTPPSQNNTALLLIILFCCLPLHSYFPFSLSVLSSSLPLALSLSALFSPSFCLSLVVLNVKLKQELGTVCEQVPKTPWDRPLSELRTSPAFVSPVRPR